MTAKTLTLVGAVLASVLVSGCGGGYYAVDPIFTRSPSVSQNSFYKTESVNDRFSREVVVDFESKEFKTQLSAARASQRGRNDLLLKLVMFSEQICTEHLGSIKGTSSEVNLGLGFLTSFFSAMASISAGTAAKTYAATSTVTNSSRSLVNEEVYRQHFADAITEKINETRKAKRAAIVAGLDLPLQSYSIDRGITDLVDYHQECSFYRGASSLLDAAKKRPTEGAGPAQDSASAAGGANPTTIVNPIVADKKVVASVATLSGGYHRYELRLVDTASGKEVAIPEASAKVVTGSAINFDTPNTKASLDEGALVILRSYVYKTPAGAPLVRDSIPAVFYPTAEQAAIKASQGTLETTGKVRLALEFPKNYERAYPGLPEKMIATAEYKNDDVKVQFNGATCAPDKDRKCEIELTPEAGSIDTITARPFGISLTMNFEQPAVHGGRVEVTAEPVK